MKAYHKHSLQKIMIDNRWKKRKYQRGGDWVIIGIQRWFFSPVEYEYRICFFGFDLRFWLKRELK